MPLRGLSRSMEVLLKMTNRMNRKMITSLPTLRIGLMSMICQRGVILEWLVGLPRFELMSMAPYWRKFCPATLQR